MEIDIFNVINAYLYFISSYKQIIAVFFLLHGPIYSLSVSLLLDLEISLVYFLMLFIGNVKLSEPYLPET